MENIVACERNKEQFLPVLETAYEISGMSLGAAVCPMAQHNISFLPLSFLYIENSLGEVTTCTEHVGRFSVVLTGVSVATENRKNKNCGFLSGITHGQLLCPSGHLIYASCLCSSMGFYVFLGIV